MFDLFRPIKENGVPSHVIAHGYACFNVQAHVIRDGLGLGRRSRLSARGDGHDTDAQRRAHPRVAAHPAHVVIRAKLLLRALHQRRKADSVRHHAWRPHTHRLRAAVAEGAVMRRKDAQVSPADKILVVQAKKGRLGQHLRDVQDLHTLTLMVRKALLLQVRQYWVLIRHFVRRQRLSHRVAVHSLLDTLQCSGHL